MTDTARATAPTRTGLLAIDYRTIWRWHFYAGLFCLPFIIILALSGSLYLFKPQIEAALDRPYDNLTVSGPPMAPSALASAAINSVPGSRLRAYQLPERANDAVRVVVSLKGEDTLVYLHPTSGKILKAIAQDDRFMAIVRSVHGELLMGDNGSLLVELAASWAIVMMITGLYLWWPRNARGLAGVLYPRIGAGKIFWRDLHAVTGIWISGFVLVLLISGLPWTNVWGDGFKAARELTGTAAKKQDWGQSRAAERRENNTEAGSAPAMGSLSLDDAVALARPFQLTPPVLIAPPNAKQNGWVVRSDTANRPLRETIALSSKDGSVLFREKFTDRHPIDQVVGVGLAVHEGALFGWLNQLIGALSALGLVLMSVSAFVLWRKRAPTGLLGAPPPVPSPQLAAGLTGIIVFFAVFLPMLGASLIIVALIERFVLTRMPQVRRWLGLPTPTPSHPMVA